MDLEKLTRQLNLMTILTQNKTYTIDDICPMVGMSRRTVYRYLEAFRQAGFIVVKEGTRYRLDKQSPFFRKVTECVHFTDDEAQTINQLLYSVTDRSPQIRHLREKLAHLYDAQVLSSHKVDERVAENMKQLFKAVREGRVCILRGYNSANSKKTSDRVVEPFQFLSENTEIRCWEPSTQTNKTFKLSRMASVDVLDLTWSDRRKHEAVYTDLFHFSGPQRTAVRILLGRLATSVLLEEYPEAEQQLIRQRDGRMLLQTDVCSFAGIERFVLGLSDDIEVLSNKEFRDYLRERIEKMKEIF